MVKKPRPQVKPIPAKPANVAKAEMIQTPAGRPAGSANRHYADLVVLPPACPMCEGTNFTPRQQTISREINGTLLDGRIYNRIVWSKARCTGCGQWVAFREFHLVNPQ